jgi:GDPmannose 4,6-dehydratase
MTKKALITGITGQDGAYLSDFLLKKGYKVYGAVRRTSSINTARLSYMDVLDNIELVSMDLGEITNIQRTIEKIEPDEIYNLAAQSFVQTSYEQPIYTSDIDWYWCNKTSRNYKEFRRQTKILSGLNV